MNKIAKTLLPVAIVGLVVGGIIVKMNTNEDAANVESSVVNFEGEFIPNSEAIETVDVIEKPVENNTELKETSQIITDTFSKESVISYIENTYDKNASSLIIVFLANEALFTKDNYKNLLEGMNVFLSNPDNKFANMVIKSAEVKRLVNL